MITMMLAKWQWWCAVIRRYGGGERALTPVSGSTHGTAAVVVAVVRYEGGGAVTLSWSGKI